MTAAVDAAVPREVVVVGRRWAIARWEVVAVVAAMAVVAVVGVVAISRDAPLLWDEAVYSLRVRDLVGDGVRGHYWIQVRAPGLPLLLVPTALLWEASDVSFRATALVFAVAGVGLTWIIARLLTGPAPAAVAAWLLAAAPGWNESSWQVMPDIPGAVLTLTAMAIILIAARGERLSWWALLAAPLAGAATMVRYGAPLLIGPAVVAALLLRWPVARASGLRTVATVTLPALAAGIVWFVPAVTGSRRPPVFIYATRQDNKAIPALESAADFLSKLLTAVGPVVGLLVVVGAVAAVVAARRHRPLRAPVVACALIALSVLVLMLFGIAQYHLRYLAPSLPFVAILAAVGLVHLARGLNPRVTIAAGVAVGLLATGVAATTATDRATNMYRNFHAARDAYHHVAAVTNDPCVILDRTPSAEWYSGCALFRPARVRLALRRLPRAGVAPDEPIYIVLRSGRSPVDLLGDSGRLEPGDRSQGAWLRGAAVDTAAVSPGTTVVDMGPVQRFTALLERRRALRVP